MARSVVLTGFKELDRKLARLGGQGSARAVVAGVRAAMQITKRAVIAEINATQISTPHGGEIKAAARKLIGARFNKKIGRGQYGGKVGFAVGVKRARHFELVSSGATRGVGIAAANIHWFVLGTAERRSSRGSRGKLPPFFEGAIKRAEMASAGPAIAAAAAKIRVVIDREAKRRA